MTTRCDRVDAGARSPRGQVARDGFYALIVIVCFLLGIGVVVGAMASARLLLGALP